MIFSIDYIFLGKGFLVIVGNPFKFLNIFYHNF